MIKNNGFQFGPDSVLGPKNRTETDTKPKLYIHIWFGFRFEYLDIFGFGPIGFGFGLVPGPRSPLLGTLFSWPTVPEPHYLAFGYSLMHNVW